MIPVCAGLGGLPRLPAGEGRGFRVGAAPALFSSRVPPGNPLLSPRPHRAGWNVCHASPVGHVSHVCHGTLESGTPLNQRPAPPNISSCNRYQIRINRTSPEGKPDHPPRRQGSCSRNRHGGESQLRDTGVPCELPASRRAVFGFLPAQPAVAPERGEEQRCHPIHRSLRACPDSLIRHPHSDGGLMECRAQKPSQDVSRPAVCRGLCPLVRDPGEGCFCSDLRSQNIEAALRYCCGNYQECRIFKSREMAAKKKA